MAKVDAIEVVGETAGRMTRAMQAMWRGEGDTSAELATALSILVGEGKGNGWLVRLLEERQALDNPIISVPTGPIADSPSVRFALRSSRPERDLPPVTLSEYLAAPSLYMHLDPASDPIDLTLQQLVRAVRNKLGAHVDVEQPGWLTECRIYPCAGQDVISFLLYEAALGVARMCARTVGLEQQPRWDATPAALVVHEVSTRYEATTLDVRTKYILVRPEAPGTRIPMFGYPASNNPDAPHGPGVVGVLVTPGTGRTDMDYDTGIRHSPFGGTVQEWEPGAPGETLRSVETRYRNRGRPSRAQRRRPSARRW